MKQSKPPPPVITVYKNGDKHFYGKKIVVNRKQIRTFDCLLDKVTKATESDVAVRKVHSANSGNRIVNLEEIRNGGNYVAAGIEKFMPLDYDKIHEERNMSKPMSLDVTPVAHSKVIVASRCRKEAMAEGLKNRIIFVFSNGNEKDPAQKLLLDKRILQSMDSVLQYISDKINLKCGAVRSIYTVDGYEVCDTKEIISNAAYVAVGSERHFMKRNYSNNYFASPSPHNSVSCKITSSSKNKALSRNKNIKPREKKGGKKNLSGISNMTLNGEDSTESGYRNDTDKYDRGNEKKVEKENNIPRDKMSAISPNESARKWIKEVEIANNSSHVEEDIAPEANQRHSNSSNNTKRQKQSPKMYQDEIKLSHGEAYYNEESDNTSHHSDLFYKRTTTASNVANSEIQNDNSVFPVYKATGNQSETAETVKENNETNVEKTIDMVKALEVEEEIEVGESDYGDKKQNIQTVRNGIETSMILTESGPRGNIDIENGHNELEKYMKNGHYDHEELESSRDAHPYQEMDGRNI